MSCASGFGPILYAPFPASFRARETLALADGTPIDLTGATVIKDFKRSPTLPDAEAEITLTVGDGITIVDALAGLIEWAVTSTQAASLVPFGPYYHRTVAIVSPTVTYIPDNVRG